MRVVVMGDVHSDIETIMELLDKVKGLEPDVAVFTGDFVDNGIEFKGFTQANIAKIVIEDLKLLGVPIISVPGNNDGEILDVLKKSGTSIHGSGKVVNGVGFYGFGGAKTPFGTSLEPSEEELESGILAGYEKVKSSKVKIQVTHNPPYNTKMDMIGSGAHVGSNAVRTLIEELKPTVAVCAHIHEARGVDVLGQTKLINAGKFAEGYCGLIEIDDSGNITAIKLVNLI